MAFQQGTVAFQTWSCTKQNNSDSARLQRFSSASNCPAYRIHPVRPARRCFVYFLSIYCWPIYYEQQRKLLIHPVPQAIKKLSICRA